jgi:hypothetical protein
LKGGVASALPRGDAPRPGPAGLSSRLGPWFGGDRGWIDPFPLIVGPGRRGHRRRDGLGADRRSPLRVRRCGCRNGGRAPGTGSRDTGHGFRHGQPNMA